MGSGHAPALARGNNRGRIFALLALGLAAGCGGDPGPLPEAPVYTDPGFVELEGWRLHYALTATRDLPSAIAHSYGIVQRPNLALLVVALESRPPREPAGAEVAATAVSLTGERRTLALARRDEAGRPTWIATVDVRHREPITIELEARATAAGPGLHARLTREFRFE